MAPTPSRSTTKANKGAPVARRKPLHAIDTSLRSYDRTDPFAAFNVLLKLLGSLPSRIGGCQYKLHADEHKLAMHLLGIVEPFVGLAPSKRTLTRQPTEILDTIAFHVDARRDLVSLALSCKRMHDVVCPRHVDYRVIKCKVSNVGVWNHLIVNRALARNVRELEVLDERSTETAVVPRGERPIRDTDLESTDDELVMHSKQERFFVSALAKMTALHSFKWSCNHSPISVDDVWPTLLMCPSLSSVDIRDNLVFGPYSEEDKPKGQFVLPKMKQVSLQSTRFPYGAARTPTLSRVSDMLVHTPNLESLAINYTPPRVSAAASPSVDTFLLLGRYPALTSLTLTNLSLTSAHPPVAFLEAHAALETLSLDITAPTGGKPPLLDLAPGTLPNLRELKACKEVAAALLVCTPDRPLETLKGVSLGGVAADASFLRALHIGGAQLRRLELARGGWAELDDVRRLTRCVPALRTLDIGPSRKREKVAVPAPPHEWASVLSTLPELAAFHGVRFFYEVNPLISSSAPVAGHLAHVHAHTNSTSNAASTAPVTALDRNVPNVGPSDRSRMRKNDEVAAVLVRRCARLRRLDHWEDGGARVVILTRGTQIGWEVRRIKA